MFTGIIEHIGRIEEVIIEEHGISFAVSCDLFKSEKLGKSFAINGVCLTQVRYENMRSYFDVTYETLKKTNLGSLKEKDFVHIEPAMAAQSSFDGHMVQGHVDGTAKLVSITKDKLVIELPDDLKKFVVSKGSVAIDGVSLTIAEIQDNVLTIALIPHTYEHTLFKDKETGLVNIEIDLFAKMIFKYLDQTHTSEIAQ